MFSRCEATITVEVTEQISLRVPCMLEAGHDYGSYYDNAGRSHRDDEPQPDEWGLTVDYIRGSDHVARVTWSSTDGS